MTRGERIHSIMAAFRADVLMPAIDSNLLHSIAVLALDTADATRTPQKCCECDDFPAAVCYRCGEHANDD